MTGALTVQVKGLKQLERALRLLPKKAQGQALRSAARAGAVVLQKAAIANLGAAIPRATTTKDVIIKRKRRGRRFDEEWEIGAPKDKFHLNIIELGATPHVVRAKNRSILSDGSEVFGEAVNHPGLVARPWLRPALDTQRNAAIKATGEQLARRIEREAERLSSSVQLPRRRR